MKLWKKKLADGKTASFQVLNLLLENEAASFVYIQNILVEHLTKLIVDFDHYIPDNVSKYSWVRNTFNVDVEDLPKEISSIAKLQEQPVEIQNDETLLYNLIKTKGIVECNLGQSAQGKAGSGR